MEDLFAFLERDLAGERQASTAMLGVLSPLEQVAELANADWSEDEAGTELARTCDRLDLLWAQHLLLNSLMRNAGLDRQGVQMARIVARALSND